MKLFNFNKNKKATKAKKDKPKKAKRGFFGKRDKDDFIKKMGVSIVVEASFVEDLRKKVEDAEQPYIQIDPEGHVIYLLGLTNALIKGTTLETDSEALGALASAMENANKRGDCEGSVTNATFDTDLMPVPDENGEVPPSQVIFMPTINTLNELQNIAGKDQEFEVVCIPSDITANNYNHYLQEGTINCPVIKKDATKDMSTEEATLLVTIPEFKEFVKNQTTLDSTNSYNDEEMGINDSDDTADPTEEDTNSDDAEFDDENGDDSSIPTFGSDADNELPDDDLDDQTPLPDTFDEGEDDGFGDLDDDGDGGFGDLNSDSDNADDSDFDSDFDSEFDSDDDSESPAEFTENNEVKTDSEPKEKAEVEPNVTEINESNSDKSESDNDKILKDLDQDDSLDDELEDDDLNEALKDNDLDTDNSTTVKAETDDANETDSFTESDEINESDTPAESEPVITEEPQVTEQVADKSANTGQISEGTVATETTKPAVSNGEEAVEIKAPAAGQMALDNNAVPEVSEGETLVDMKNPDSAFVKIDPSIKKNRELSDSNRRAREELRNEFGQQIDKWLNDKLKAPKLWIKDGASYGKKFLVQMNLYNDMLNSLVREEREKIKSSIMQQIDSMIDMVTDPAEFDHIFEAASKKLHKEFLDKERMQQEIVTSMNQINQDYDELHEALINHAQDEAEKEYQTKYIPERDQELTQAESKVKNKHKSLYDQAVDAALARVRQDTKPLISQHLNELMTQNQTNLDQAGLTISSQVRTYMSNLLGQATIDAEMSKSTTPEQVAKQTTQVSEAAQYQHEQELQTRDQKIAQLTQRLKDEENRRKDIEAVNASTREQLNQVQAENVKYRRDSLDAQNSVQQHESESKSMADTIRDLKQQLSDKDKTAEELMKSKAKLVDSNQQLTDELKNLKSHAKGLNNYREINDSDINREFNPHHEQVTEKQQDDAVITTPIQPVEEAENKDLPKSGPVHSPQL